MNSEIHNPKSNNLRSKANRIKMSINVKTFLIRRPANAGTFDFDLKDSGTFVATQIKKYF